MRPLRSLALLLGTLLCVATTVGLFARAYPMVDVGLALDRAGAIARGRSLAAAAGFAPARADAAALFETDDSLSTYVDFAAGGADSVRALARGGDVPLYRWVVRLYRPGDVHETRVAFAPDGRVVGLTRQLPEAESRPLVTDTAGHLAADAALARWGSQDLAAWRLTGRSVVTQPRSARVDRTYRYERVGRRIGDAPIRADVTVTGPAAPAVLRGGAVAVVGSYAAEPLAVRVYADLPDAWTRRYGEMRSANNTLALLPYPTLAVFVLGALGALVYFGRLRRVRWRPAAAVGGTVGLLMALAGLNELPVAWFHYDTATAPSAYVASITLGALAGGVLAGGWVMLAVAAAEVCARRAFPTHYDWFSYPRFAGAPPLARRILGAYALAAFGFAYVTVFYVAMRGTFGWWVPAGTLDDPNQIATPAPWVSAAGLALFAGTWEEAIFRGVPLALLAIWAHDRKARRFWLAAGVVVTALTFGFGHANYPSWPAYSRGVELFLEAVLWAVLALRVGLPTTIIAHALYDLTWFGLFALHGRGPAYRATAGAVLIAFSLPALVVAVNWWQRRRAAAAGLTLEAPPRFADVTRALDEQEPRVVRGGVAVTPAHASVHLSPPPEAGVAGGERWTRGATPATAVPDVVAAPRVGPRTRVAAAVVTALALLVALLAPRAPTLGPAFTASRTRVAAAADSALRARGVDPAAWDHTLVVGGTENDRALRFLRESLGRTRATALARRLGDTYLAPALWQARYVRRHATRDVRREEWTVVVAPDGRVRTVVHDVADDAPGAAPSTDSARRLAATAVRTRGYDPATLRETELRQQNRPHRLDTEIQYVDPAVALPAGATARVGVTLAGTEPVRVARELRLPESWTRADEHRASTYGPIAGLSSIALLGLFIALTVQGIRRAEPRLPTLVDRRAATAIALAVALLTAGRTLSSLPDRLAAWRTTDPWSNYLATLVIGGLLGAVFAGVATAGAWALADALRRRAGVPVLPTDDSDPSNGASHRVRDGVLLGAALGTALPALAGLGDFVRSAAGTPPAPSTALDALFPWAAPALGAAASAITAPLAALPALAIAAGARTPRARWLALAAVAVLAAVSAQVAADASLGRVTIAAASVASIALVAGVVWAFGRAAAVSWLVAGPAAGLVAELRAARTADNPTDRAAALVATVASAALILLVYRLATHMARADAELPASVPQPADAAA
ncbi:hypothetical protein tb265_16910 [Gemmatimonadetes bacterium T265]|nr:hypothetical protein tb265_16910 [Gemmatimonadetes bacterium T265]